MNDDELIAFDVRYIRVEGLRYDYVADKCQCPVCGDVGFPWRGWFTCDYCPAVALVYGGDVFMPAGHE
jgi:hypothetical protein